MCVRETDCCDFCSTICVSEKQTVVISVHLYFKRPQFFIESYTNAFTIYW